MFLDRDAETVRGRERDALFSEEKVVDQKDGERGSELLPTSAPRDDIIGLQHEQNSYFSLMLQQLCILDDLLQNCTPFARLESQSIDLRRW